MSARDRILERVKAATDRRPKTDHPGDFGAWRPDPFPYRIDWFEELFQKAGGEVVRVADTAAAAAWIAGFAEDFDSMALGETVPATFVPGLRIEPPRDAELGVSMAWGAVAETGSLIMDARDGRRAQLLADTHVVVLHSSKIFGTLAEALVTLQPELPSAVGLHSGPSKSADIGQVMVKGVHGPGRVVAVVVD